MANDFIKNNKEEKIRKNVDDSEEEINWTEPISESSELKEVKKNSALVSLYAKKKKKLSSTDLAYPKVPAPRSSSGKKIKKIKERNKSSFFDIFLSYFKAEQSEKFKDQKKNLLKQKEIIDQEKEKKEKKLSSNDTEHKDIGEVVKERLKENKIEISDGRIIKTNLMDGGPTILINWKKNFLFLFLGLFAVAVVIVIIYSFLLITKHNESAEGEMLDQEIEIVNSQIAVARKSLSEIDALKKKILISNKILDRHIYWTNFFKFLEENTLENVYYLNGISGNAGGDYSFSSITDDYKNITEQLMVLKNNDLVLEANVSSGHLEDKNVKPDEEEEESLEKQISFDLSLKLVPEIFYK